MVAWSNYVIAATMLFCGRKAPKISKLFSAKFLRGLLSKIYESPAPNVDFIRDQRRFNCNYNDSIKKKKILLY